MPQEQQPDRSAPTINQHTGLIDPTIADAMFLAICTPGYDESRGINLLVWGEPGTGKTATSKDVIRRAGKTPYYIDLSLAAPEDLAGIPKVVEEEVRNGKVVKVDGQVSADGSTVKLEVDLKDEATGETFKRYISIRAIDATWLAIAADPTAVLIADDITNAAQMVQAAMLRIALEKGISDGRGGLMPLKHMAFLAMANFGDGNALQPLLGPLANRFSHIEATVRRDVLRYWNTHRKSQLTLDISRRESLDAAFPALFDKYMSLLNEFVIDHQLNAFDVAPSEFNTAEEHAYATSRTYEFCARWMAACEHFSIDPSRFVKASVGPRVSTLLFPWLRTRELGMLMHTDSLKWKDVDTSERERVSMWAARHFKNDTELENTIKSIDKLVGFIGGSHDNNVPARDYLIHRALGLPVLENGQVDDKKGAVAPVMTEAQVALVRKAWTREYFQRKAKHQLLLGNSGGSQLAA